MDTLYRNGHRPTVLVDLLLSRMDGSGGSGGMELLELIHDKFADLPVLTIADCRNSDAERKVHGLGYAFMLKPRSNEMGNRAVIASFSDRLLTELARIESGEAPSQWSNKVNIGDELRLEMGEDPAPAAAHSPQSTGISLLRGMMEELYDPGLGGGIILLVSAVCVGIHEPGRGLLRQA